MNDTIARWYRFALQQMAAESMLDRFLLEGRALETVLNEGNTDTRRAPEPSGYTRMPAAQAAEFIANNQVVAHRANDATGFSGTLLRDQGTGEYTLSIRSTEYKNLANGGDAERDNLRGANGEIVLNGFALGQLAALEDFYQREVLPVVGANKINVTGYSLGGHLATVFTETHAVQVKAAYVFNAAGRGRFVVGDTTAERMAGMIAQFQATLVSEPNADVLSGLSSEARKQFLPLYQSALQAHLADPGWNPFAPTDASIYADPRYRWARAVTNTLGSFQTGPGLPFRAGLGTAGDALITSIYGSALNNDTTLVANAQIHPSNKNAVFIEGQPFVEGLPPFQDRSDFGNTHAITIIADSLALQREFERLDPSLTRAQIEAIIQASSAQKTKVSATLTDATAAEGDSLERVLISLRKAFDDSAPDELPVSRVPGGFGNIANRQRFYEELALLPQQGEYAIEVLAGKTSGQIAALAKRNDATGLAVRYALLQLDAFAVVGGDYASSRYPNGELDFSTDSSGRGVSAKWIDARSRMLEAVTRYNAANGDLTVAQISGYFQDQQKNIALGSPQPGRARVIFASDTNEQAVIGFDRDDLIFGGANGEAITANGGDDYVEGDGGVDTIDGGAGSDQLHGGAGNDRLTGGSETDHLFGDTNDDRLEGGKGNDYLHGGAGFDTYVYAVEDGRDVVRDSDGSGQIDYKGRILSGGALAGSHTYKDGAGTVYEIVPGAGGMRTLFIDGTITVENFVSGNLGIVLSGEPGNPAAPPEITAEKVYGQFEDYGTVTPYPIDQDLDAPFGQYLNMYGSEADDRFNYTGFAFGFPGFYGRAGEDWVSVHGAVSGATVDGGADGDYIDASDSSYDGSPFAQPLILAGGSGDDFILGGNAGETIWGDNYRTQDNFNRIPGVSGSTNSFLIDNFIFNLRDAFVAFLGEQTPATLAALAQSGAYYFENGPEPAYAGFRSPESVFRNGGFEDLVQYAQLEGWQFPGGLGSVLDYLLGIDPSFDDYIDGGAGDDKIKGGSGSDTILGGAGNDVIDGDAGLALDGLLASFAERFGESGSDSIYGGEGDDRIVDSAGALNFIDGGDGDDTIGATNRTADGFDVVLGGAGNDVISVTSLGGGAIYGGDGNDSISAGTIFFGPTGVVIGTGRFDVDGGAGNDIYGISNGIIRDSEGDDTIGVPIDLTHGLTEYFATYAFQPSAIPAGFELTEEVFRDGLDLRLERTQTFAGEYRSSSVTIADWFLTDQRPIEHIPMEGGTELTPAQLETWGSYEIGTNGGMEYFGGDYSDRILALGGSDIVATGDGDDLIGGGAGDDLLDGGSGNDSYFYALGDGNDTIVDIDGNDRLVFAPAIGVADVSVISIGASSIFLAVAGSTLELVGSGSPGELAIETLEFADGYVVAVASLIDSAVLLNGAGGNDVLTGTAAANVITGGLGDDLLSGGAGDDTYAFSMGDGIDRIVDLPAPGEVNTVHFGPGISPDMLTLGLGSLLIRVGTSGDAIHLEGVDAGDIAGAHDIDVFEFDDGSRLTYQELLARGVDLYGSQFDEVITGSSIADRVHGYGGDDLLIDGAGDDVYFFSPGDGNDLLAQEAAGGDLDMLSFAAEIAPDSVSIQRSGSDILLLLDGSRGSVTLLDAYLYDVIEQVSFADGTNLTGEELRRRVSGNENRAPETVADAANLREDLAVLATGNLLANDSDADAGDTLSVSNPGTYVGMYGELTLAGDGSYGYALGNASAAVQSLREGEVVVEDFTYFASDGLASTPGTLSVSITGANDAPTLANPISDQNASAGMPFSISIGADTFIDVDAGDSLAYSASLSNGAALPSWLTFNATTRTFSGTAPDGIASAALQLRVAATDLAGTSAQDTFGLNVAGGGGIAPIVGTDHDDVLTGTTGNDVIDGREGFDRMSGGAGNDVYYVDETRGRVDQVVESANEGYDTVYASIDYTLVSNVEELHLIGRDDLDGKGNSAANILVGNVGDNKLFGESGNDLLLDDAGEDRLDGGAGDDVLDGGSGDDTLVGGAGNDLFVHTGRGGNDVVQESGGADEVRFGEGIAASQVTVRRASNDLVLRLSNGNGSVTVKDWFSSSAKRVEQVRFADGVVWNENQIRARVSSGGAGGPKDDYLGGCDERPRAHTNSRDSGDDGDRHDQHGRDHRDERSPGAMHDAITQRLNRDPNYDFTALTAYLQRQGGSGYGAMTASQIAAQWNTVQDSVANLALDDDDCGSGGGWHGGHGSHWGWGGRDDDRNRCGNWGHQGSTGRNPGCGGMNAFSGLGEGFRRL